MMYFQKAFYLFSGVGGKRSFLGHIVMKC